MGQQYDEITLTDSFFDDRRAERQLRRYYHRRDGKPPAYSGALWDTFDPSGTRSSSDVVFTGDDLVACALLSTPIGGRAVVQLLGHRAAEFAELLDEIDPDLVFIDADPDFATVTALYRALRSVPAIGPTRATKLLARKRPNLVPIVDGVIRQALFAGGHEHWAPLHRTLTGDGGKLWKWLETMKAAAGLDEQIPILRVLDVLAWMDATQRPPADLVW